MKSARSRGPLRLRPAHLAPIVIVLAALAAWLVARKPDVRRPAERPEDAASKPAAPAPSDAEPAALRSLTAFWPAADQVGLRQRAIEVPARPELSEQAAELVKALLSGPGEASLAAPLPAGTTLRALYLDTRGTAYVDLSAEAARGPGGSSWEILAVSSVANSLTRSFPDIRRVQILVDGQEIETLAGHLDLTRPVAFDASLVVPG